MKKYLRLLRAALEKECVQYVSMWIYMFYIIHDVLLRRVGGTNRKGSLQVQQVLGFEKYYLCRRSFQIPAVPYDQRQGDGLELDQKSRKKTLPETEKILLMATRNPGVHQLRLVNIPLFTVNKYIPGEGLLPPTVASVAPKNDWLEDDRFLSVMVYCQVLC